MSLAHGSRAQPPSDATPDANGTGVVAITIAPPVAVDANASRQLTANETAGSTPAAASAGVVPCLLSVRPIQPDPFTPQEEFDPPMCARILLFLLDLILVPLRLIAIVLLMTLLAAICRILLIGAPATPHDNDTAVATSVPKPGFGPKRVWLIRHAVWLIGKPIVWSFGIVTSYKAHALARTHTGFLVANHPGYAEILALVAQYVPSVVAKAEIASYPLIGTIARALQCVFVDRRDPAARARAMAEMLERGRNVHGRYPPLLIFPEGTNNSGTALLQFQKGIFTAGLPVQPVAVKSHFAYYNAGWVSGSMGKHVLGLIRRVYHPLSLKELPCYEPSETERADAILYAGNVTQTVANALLVPVSPKTLYDNPELVHLGKHRASIVAPASAATTMQPKASTRRNGAVHPLPSSPSPQPQAFVTSPTLPAATDANSSGTDVALTIDADGGDATSPVFHATTIGALTRSAVYTTMPPSSQPPKLSPRRDAWTHATPSLPDVNPDVVNLSTDDTNHGGIQSVY